MGMQTVGRMLEQRRKGEGQPVGRTAEHFKVSRFTYGRWERGTHRPRFEHLLKIAKYLGLKVDALVRTLEMTE